MDAGMIDPASGVQPWRQLLRILTEQIDNGTLTGALPGERRLSDEYRISSGSVRKALAALRDAGYIETVPGWGSRVVPPEERSTGP
jgi:DNA-binding GntR family transcriptional regulator